MGLIGWVFKTIFKLLVFALIFVAIVVLVPGIPPKLDFTPFSLAPKQSLEGVKVNYDALNNAEKILVNSFHGPEFFTVHDGSLYTGIHGGEVVKISPQNHVTFVTKLGKPCEGFWQEAKCGRPLAVEFDKNGQMYVADAYYGIWKVDPATDKKVQLVSPDDRIGGVAPKIIISLAIASNGDIYWTDASSDYALHDGFLTMLADPSGRLIHYEAATKQSRVLLDKLWFGNGVVLSPEEDFVVVAETMRQSLRRVYVKGPKKGKRDIFVDGLPGAPDNLQVLPDGSGILVSLILMEEDDHPHLGRTLARLPVIRKFLLRVLTVVELGFKFLNEQFPNLVFEQAIHKIGHFETATRFFPQRSALVKVDWNGKIVEIWASTDGSAAGVSDAIVYNNKLYLGSPFNHFISRINIPEGLKGAFKSAEAQRAKVTPSAATPKPAEAKKPVEAPKPKPVEAPKPTTPKPVDTPKPTTPKPVEKPKPVEAPKPTTPKPAEAPKPTTPKPVEAPKVTTPKPVEQQKPVEKPKPTTPKPVETPKPTTPKPTEAPRHTTAPPPKPTASEQKQKPVEKIEPAKVPPPTPQAKKQESQTATPKEAQPRVTTPPPKPAPAKEAPKPAEVPKPKEEAPKKPIPTAAPPSTSTGKPSPPKPIVEEIPSDTVAPSKDTLNVITKDGPTKIPHPAH